MKKIRSIIALALSLTLCLALCACGTKKPAGSGSDLVMPAKQKDAGDEAKQAILVVSFGTSYNETRALTIDAIEAAITQAFPEFDVRRAFTSQIIIDKLKTRDGLEIDNVTEAAKKLVAEGYGTLVVAPTHIMNGYEYDEMVAAIEPYRSNFEQLAFAKPLLTDETDYEKVAEILAGETEGYAAPDTAVVFMGHGTEHPANDTYAKLQQSFIDAGCENYIVATVEAAPTLGDALTQAKALGVSKVALLPLMIVAGDHASNDMAGDEEGSWKVAFKGDGYEVECVLRGLGEYSGVQELFVEHTQAAVDSLSK